MPKLNTTGITANSLGNWTSDAITFTDGSKTVYMRVNGTQVLQRDFTISSVGTNLVTGDYVIKMLDAAVTGYIIGGTPTVTVNYASAPDGAFSGQATRFLFADSTYPSGRLERSLANFSMSTSTQYTVSWYVKLATGSPVTTAIRYYIESKDGGGSGGTWPAYSNYPQLSSSTWTRLSITFTTDSTDTGIKLWVINNIGEIGADLLFWGLKIEAGASVTGTPANLG